MAAVAGLLLALAGCTAAPAAPVVAPAARYHLVGTAGALSFEAPGAGNATGATKLLPGFGMSIVEQRAVGGRRWGRTGQGRWIAMADLAPARPAPLTGVVLPSGASLDFGWVVTTGAMVLEGPTPAARRVGSRALFTRETLAEPCVRPMCHTTSGWMRAEDLRVPRPAPPPAGVGPTDRWLDVDLPSQTLIAYQGDRPVFATLVSTGIGALGSPLSTPAGVFRIRSKHRAASMDNLEHTGVVPYSYEDIPLVQYFTDRVALHAALWHQRFGHPASHGCINLTPPDAERLFAFTSPVLPPSQTDLWVRPSAAATVIRVRR